LSGPYCLVREIRQAQLFQRSGLARKHPLLPGSGTFPIKQIDVCPFNELIGRYAQLPHQITRDRFAGFRGLALRQDDLELEKTTQVFDPIEVNARFTGKE
jgi:hypothetical protein